ncbi:MAG: energy-coupling factor transporter ATPase [Oscillospiraceae bacterium]|nr:energy-coupling factor transporter ATPase [Oscillospiraceae bacterium]MBQ5815877.1 energy-coupling factor transporter ATPase [Oscillospiraceae bacterium]
MEENKLSIIKISDLTYCYGKGTPFERKALDNISFNIEKGEFVAIIGHTGSGKSTLVSHLNGLSRAESGEVLFNGENIFKKGYDMRALRFKVGLVFQYPEYQLFEETVYRDIAFGPKNMGLSDEEVKERVIWAAKALEIKSELLNKSPFELSGGQKRRVAIAGVIAMRPEVLVLDEPAAGLDPAGRDRVMRLITDYRDKTGSTVVIVSHSMETAARYADKIVVLNDGKLFMVGTPDEVFKKADEIEKIGLSVPPVTRLVHALIKEGYDLPENIYTAEKAAEALLSLKAKGGAK